MDIEKIRNLGEEELLTHQQESAEQLFRLRFQMKMGQTESITKMRTLRKDIARIKTVLRQRELGQEPVVASLSASRTKAKPAAEAAAAKTPAKAAKPAAKKTAAKKAAKPAAKKAAKKKPEKK
jgi:large subunit ribosomal protein L29